MRADLRNNAITPSGAGHSYEVLSYWSVSGTYVDKTIANTSIYRRTIDPLAGSIPGPAMTMLLYDAMDLYTPDGVENYPSAYAAHGAEGGNMLLADAHAEWIPTKDWAYRWAISQNTALKSP
jgi:hypothetical protein